MKQFLFDVVLNEENICNLEKERKKLVAGVKAGKHFVVYGRRNLGKTSVIKSVVIPSFIKNNSNAFVLFADLMGVRSLEQIQKRISRAFKHGFKNSFPTQAFVKSLFEVMKSLRPTLSADPVEGPVFSVSAFSENKTPDLEDLFDAVSIISRKTPCLIVLDESRVFVECY